MEGDCFIVLDAFALPVEGTETRVNAQQEAYEYIIDFAETNKVRVINAPHGPYALSPMARATAHALGDTTARGLRSLEPSNALDSGERPPGTCIQAAGWLEIMRGYYHSKTL